MVLGTTAAAWWLSATIYNYARLPVVCYLQGRLGRAGAIAVLTIVVMLCGPWQHAFTSCRQSARMALILAFVRPATRVPRCARRYCGWLKALRWSSALS